MASIRKQRTKWQAQIRIKGAKPIAKSFPKKSEATAWARITESEIHRGIYVDPRPAASVTIADLIDRYFDSLPEKQKLDITRLSRSKRLRSDLGCLSLSMLSTQHLAEYRDRRLEVASPMTVIHELNLMHRILVLATSEWGIALPRGIPRVQRPRRPLGRSRRLSLTEENRLLHALRDETSTRNIVLFALETGMRRGEILKIQRDDIDFSLSTLSIPETKTGIPRTIPLSGNAVSILRAQVESEALVFDIAPAALYRSFNRACEVAGIEGLRFHDDLRHEATSRFFEKGLNVMEVATITGHRTLEMLNRYTHLKAEELVARL